MTAHRTCATHLQYKLSCADYDWLMAEAAGDCQSCGVSADLEIDHDHAVGGNAVRGLICRRCNLGLRAVDAGTRKPRPYERDYLARAWHVRRGVLPEPDNKTPLRSVRVDDELWGRVVAHAKERRTTASAVIRQAVVAYARDPRGFDLACNEIIWTAHKEGASQ